MDRAGAILADAGVPALALTVTGFAAGVGACVAVVVHAWPVALGLWLTNRVLDGLDGPVARRHGASELGGFLDIVADFAVYAGFIVAVAVAVPSARIASLALLCAYYVSGTAFLALSSLLERRGTTLDGAVDPAAGRYADGRSLRFVGGVAEGTETVVVYAVLCLLPGHAVLVLWAFTAAVAVTAVQRVVLGVRLLSHPATGPGPAGAGPAGRAVDLTPGTAGRTP